jgi:hypothetical protein
MIKIIHLAKELKIKSTSELSICDSKTSQSPSNAMNDFDGEVTSKNLISNQM